MTRINASDLYLTAGSPPVFRVDGVGHSGRVSLDDNTLRDMIFSMLTEEQVKEFEETHELNLAVMLSEEDRFRVNVFRQRGAVGLVARKIHTKIPKFDDLKLPETLRSVALSKRGLVLVVGATGSGKSTTLAAMIGARRSCFHGPHRDG